MYFARPDALSGTLVETLTWARPTIFFAVPRVWEKFEEKMKEAAANNKSAILRSLATWAKSKGTQKVEAMRNHQEPPLLYPLANTLLFTKVKSALGLDQT